MNVFIFQQNQQSGPFAAEAFQEMVRMGSVAGDASVWQEGTPDWVPLATFLAQHPELAPKAEPQTVSPAAERIRAMTPAASLGRPAPSEGGVFLKALGAALGVGIGCGIGWAVLQAFTGIQLPYIIGVGIAWACGKTVDKVSGGASGSLFAIAAVGACILAWLIGILGVALADQEPRIGIWTIVCFFFALGMTWKTATE